MDEKVTLTIERTELNVILNALIQAKYNRENAKAAKQSYEEVYDKLSNKFNWDWI